MPDYKADFHTHSILSHDGGITLEQYEKILNTELLDYVAITDHNEIDFALHANKKLGERIIVGEEIKSRDGEIIGLFLSKKIPPKLSVEETVEKIKSQNGIVYIPHPNIPFLASVKTETIIHLREKIDVIEFFNAKNVITQILKENSQIGIKLGIPRAAGSDSHSFSEVGRTYNIVNTKITRNNLPVLLKGAKYSLSYIKPWHMINPKLNKIKKIIYG